MNGPFPFDSIYAHGFVRTAVAVPTVRLANPAFNVERMLGLARKAAERHVAVVVFPELGITGYSLDDLFQQEAVLECAQEALLDLMFATRELCPALVVGYPMRVRGSLFNCAAVLHRGKILGVVPKTYIPNYREFYEKRQFSSGAQADFSQIEIGAETVPFGTNLIFRSNLPNFAFFVEICEDLWSPIPPSSYAALGGATVLANLSASNITIGKADYRRALAASQSGRCISAYLYSAAGGGESTTDLAWDGHGMIFENAQMLAETARFESEECLAIADVDLERLTQERMRITSFNDTAFNHREQVSKLREIDFELCLSTGPVPLERTVERFPFVPSDSTARDKRCHEAYNIQVAGLSKRLESSGYKRVVIGVSGGLDSAHALIVAAKTMDRLKLPRTNVLAYTMPGFATSDRTLNNARRLMGALGVTAGEIDIVPSCNQMLKDIGHPHSADHEVFDITFENVQAGERTSHLFRLANLHRALVMGTGDLSELALGWCTYGVGDHMSHYNVNASVPKTLIQYLIRWVDDTDQFGEKSSEVFQSILETEISPELVPDGGSRNDQPHQSSEDIVGPYDLADFNIYFITRFGFKPSKVAFLCMNAWSNPAKGPWPDGIPIGKRRGYDLATIKKWLSVFLQRFFGNTQFKRTCVPNGPKVGSGGALSPRGDWRAPSDAEATIWLDELERNVPEFGSQKLEVKRQKPEVENQKPEVENQKPEAMGRKARSGRRKAE